VFHILRPRAVQTMAQLARVAGDKLHLEQRDAPRASLKGVAIRNPQDDSFIVNLSFGVSVLDALQNFSLTIADFAATDPTVEMLYLLEAKSAAMQASRKLTKRLQTAKSAAEEQAFTDTLTGLRNRRAMDQTLNRLIETKTPLSLMHIDLDHFKAVNDTLGHAAGDHVLLIVAAAFLRITRATDIVSRAGGDEFVVIMPNYLDAQTLEGIALRLINEIEKPIPFNGQNCQISASIGTVIWDGIKPANPQSLIDDADIALYASKHAGRGMQTFYEPVLRERAQNLYQPKGGSLELWG